MCDGQHAQREHAARAGSRTLESSLPSLFVPRPAAIVGGVVDGVVVAAVAAIWSVTGEGVRLEREVQLGVIDERIPVLMVARVWTLKPSWARRDGGPARSGLAGCSGRGWDGIAGWAHRLCSRRFNTRERTKSLL